LSNEIRYERASECLEVVRDLWDSWEDGAVVRDPKRKVFFEPEKVHELNHVGKHFKVRGPLNLSRPPQGHPLISQAGGSPAGWELAARTADVLFGKSNSLGEAQRFYGEVKGRMEKYGRMPDELKVVIEMKAIVGQTEKEAREKFRAIQECATETEGRATLGHYVPGVDFSNFEMDEPIPDLPEIDQAAKRFRIPLVKDGHRATLRDMIEAGAGNWTLVGTPGQVAETLIQWHEERGADGFNFIPHHLPGGLEDFVELVVPELQNRGAFQTEYAEGSLREKLGLIRPANRHTAAQK
jgi:FMN-dependent oxidoreductase (nitrilotriacetate monooxygenase family)